VCPIANRSGRDGIQSMYEQPYTIDEFARTAAALAGCLAKFRAVEDTIFARISNIGYRIGNS
jgi:hypothetical protein